MFFVYILQSKKDRGIYIGRTNNLQRRLLEHNSGKVSSTKSRKPFILLESIEVETEMGSVELEREYKKGYKREQIKAKYNI